MKIDVASDLHVDAWFGTTQLHDPSVRMWTGEPQASDFLYLDWRHYKTPDSRVLVIAGDTANTVTTTAHVIKTAAEEYEHVVFVAGNHEHYGDIATVDEDVDVLAALVAPLANVTLLQESTSVVIDGVMFLGSTGWYDFKAYEHRGIPEITARRAWNQGSMDSRYPNFGDVAPEVRAMAQAVDMAEQVRAATLDPEIKTIVCVTHMSPREDLMLWKPGDITWNSLTPSYVNTALKMVTDADEARKITHWVYGHTHDRRVTVIDGVTYVNNARGYPRENPPFSLTQIESGQ